jgi:hypothetical protein
MSKGFGKSKFERHGISAKKFAKVIMMAIRHPEVVGVEDSSKAKKYAHMLLHRLMLPREADSVIDTAPEEQLEALILQGLKAK